MVSQCSRGIGSRNFFDTLLQLGSPGNVLKEVCFEKYKLGDHKAHSLAKLALEAELFYVGDLSEEDVNAAYMKKIDTNELVGLYNKWTAAGERVLIDEAGGFTTYHIEE